MKTINPLSGLMLVILAAILGLALLYLPNWIISNYRLASSLGEFWGGLYLFLVGTGGLLVIGSAAWTIWKLWSATITKKLRSIRRNKNPSELSPQQQSQELAENLETAKSLAEQSGQDQVQKNLERVLEEFERKRVSQVLEIVVFGTISSGKSSILNLLAGSEVFATHVVGGTTVQRNEIAWPGFDRVVLVDTPGLGEIDGEDHVAIAAHSARDADLVLLVMDGPLRHSEFLLVEQLGKMEKRILICLNKSDWYHPDDQQKLIRQFASQTTPWIRPEDILPVQAQPGSRIRKKVLADGTEMEETVTIPTSIEQLAKRMLEVVKGQGKELIMANLLLQSRGLVEKAKQEVQQSLDQRAWQIVNQYMWYAGGVAAINPFPLVDIIAGCSISTKMIIDLADVYQQKVDMKTAGKWLNEMGKNLIGVLGAQGASLAIASVTASVIKSVPFAGQLAGGILQGATQALITKWIGATFIEYFRSDMQAPEGGLAGLARRQWAEITTPAELKRLLDEAREKLSGSRS
jgi:small GTP-binding protein